MSIEGHVNELQRRRDAVEKELKTHLARPAADNEEVARLKRRKLQLKDELERIKRQNSPQNIN